MECVLYGYMYSDFRSSTSIVEALELLYRMHSNNSIWMHCKEDGTQSMYCGGTDSMIHHDEIAYNKKAFYKILKFFLK